MKRRFCIETVDHPDPAGKLWRVRAAEGRGEIWSYHRGWEEARRKIIYEYRGVLERVQEDDEESAYARTRRNALEKLKEAGWTF